VSRAMPLRHRATPYRDQDPVHGDGGQTHEIKGFRPRGFRLCVLSLGCCLHWGRKS